jgi:hypothetical protein
MSDLQYRLRHHGGLWRWEVLTSRGGVLLDRGATFTRAAATSEAMIYTTHPARAVEIDTIELARSAERAAATDPARALGMIRSR